MARLGSPAPPAIKQEVTEHLAGMMSTPAPAPALSARAKRSALVLGSDSVADGAGPPKQLRAAEAAEAGAAGSNTPAGIERPPAAGVVAAERASEESGGAGTAHAAVTQNKATAQASRSSQKRGRRVDKAMLVDLYAKLYARMARPVTEASLSKEFSNKELRVLMKHNGMLINDYDQRIGAYSEKTKTAKCKILVAAAPTMIIPDSRPDTRESAAEEGTSSKTRRFPQASKRKRVAQGLKAEAVAQRRTAWQPSSHYVGVSWRKDSRRWAAAITHEGRQQHLGLFVEQGAAARAYDDAARRLRGDEAQGGIDARGRPWRLNFPTEVEAAAAAKGI